MDVAGGHLGILQLGDNVYLTHNKHKNKVNVDLELFFLLHVNDGDRCGIFGTVID